MAVTRIPALLVVVIAIGVAAGCSVSFYIYQPRTSQLQDKITSLETQLTELQSSLSEAQDMIALLETQLAELVAEDLTQLYDNVTRLTTDSASEGIIGWSPDGSKMFFQQGGHICVMNADGTNMKRLAEGVGLA